LHKRRASYLLCCATALGKTDDRIDRASLGPLCLATIEKSLFSMATPDFLQLIATHNLKSFIIMGIEVRILPPSHDLHP
jgi:hypothetical protein